MMWIPLRTGVIAGAALGLGACDRLSLGPSSAEPAPIAPAVEQRPSVEPALRRHAGETYADFSANSGVRYAPAALGLNETDSVRLLRSMAAGGIGEVLTGGGAEALVFRACAAEGCEQGSAIVAVDVASGAAFVGVKDAAGTDVLTPNDRVEALLRLNSPSRSWYNPASSAEAATP